MHYCLFDIDGTLMNTGGAGQAAMEATFAEVFGITAPIKEKIPMAGRTDRAITGDIFRYYEIDLSESNLTRFIAGYFERLPHHLQQLDGLLLPGVRKLLQQLTTQKNVTLGLLTGNYLGGATIKLEHFEIDHHFGFGGFGDNHFERDDVAGEALAEIHQRYPDENVQPHNVWVIGDTPADVQCGRAIGANVIAVGTGFCEREDLIASSPDHFFEDFSVVKDFLKLMN